MDLPDQPPGAPPTAPPTVPGEIRRERERAWPRVVGVIGIIFGMLGVLTGAWGVLGNTLLAGMMPQTAQVEQMRERWGLWMVWSSVVTLLLGVVLLAGAIGLVRQRRRSRGVLLGWSVARLLWIVVSGLVSVPMMQEQLKNASASTPGPSPAFMVIFAFVGTAIAVVWMAALPVFLLIWLARPSIRSEMALWER